jgi:hypothetical protein
MYHEDVRLKYGETVSGLATEYAYKAADWKKIWLDTHNAGLVSKRKDPAKVQPSDLFVHSNSLETGHQDDYLRGGRRKRGARARRGAWPASDFCPDGLSTQSAGRGNHGFLRRWLSCR